MRIFIAGAVLLGLCGPLSAAWNEKNAEGTREHPVVKFYPQARVDQYDEKNFDSVELVTGAEKDSDGEPTVKTEEIEGHVYRYTYEHKPGTSAYEVLRQYEAALGKAGFVTLLAGRTGKLPSNGKISGETFGAFRLDRDGKPAIYVNLSASDQGSWTQSELTIVEPGAMEQTLGAGSDGSTKP